MADDTCITRGCGRPVHATGLCSTHYSYEYRAKHGRKPSRYRIECSFCGEPAEVSKPSGRFCSLSCAKRSLNGWSRSTELVHVPSPSKPRRSPRPRVPVKSPWAVIVSGPCRRCGETFTATTGNGVASYCSSRCQRADGKDRRRALKRAAYVEDVWRSRVFERDGFRCQICGKRTDKTKVAPHPKAPTLDHIIPLAEGGEHSMVNTQCAHFLCNSTKGSTGAGDQLRLIG